MLVASFDFPMQRARMNQMKKIEWPTLVLLFLCYSAWGGATWFLASFTLFLAVVVVAVILVLHSSLQHEVLHGHPFQNKRLNEALVFPALGLAIPYQRFRDTHLVHHQNELLTDPYDDPESNYLDPELWKTLPRWKKVLFQFNNTLLGRMLIGPALSLLIFASGDLRGIVRKDQAFIRAWLLHIIGVVPVIYWVAATDMPLWAYGISAYLALSILKIRTFLEHRASERSGWRSVIIEDRGPLALLFLNNNFHAVHHAHPSVAWYKLPALFQSRRALFLKRNGDYRYSSYASVFAEYFLRSKDPVPHPLMDK